MFKKPDNYKNVNTNSYFNTDNTNTPNNSNDDIANMEYEYITIKKEKEDELIEDFSKMEIGSEPESLFILDGAYTVQEGQNDEKSLTLPGSPMGDFGLLFGPRIREKGLELRFSFFSRKKGRRMPSIAAGIGGVAG